MISLQNILQSATTLSFFSFFSTCGPLSHTTFSGYLFSLFRICCSFTSLGNLFCHLPFHSSRLVFFYFSRRHRFACFILFTWVIICLFFCVIFGPYHFIFGILHLLFNLICYLRHSYHNYLHIKGY